MIRGGLFTRYYLEEGIQQSAPYRALTPTQVAAFAAFARNLWAPLASMARPSEAETEAIFIYPMLDHLGWLNLPQQEPGAGRKDIADALLFLNQSAKAKAMAEPDKGNRFRHGVVVVENEARDTRLDRASGQAEAPSSQILRYLPLAESRSNGACAWGLLTNARLWRLYWHFAPARAEGYVEFDLEALLITPPLPPPGADTWHWLRVFLLIFSRDAFIPNGVTNKHFLDGAIAEGKRYEERVTAALTAAVFKRVFPNLMQAICREAPGAAPDDPAWRATAREAGLKFLYRLLFLFYAEDRDLLPMDNDGYAGYALRALRNEAQQIVDKHKTVSPKARNWWSRLTTLFTAIADGDSSLGLPPYNGGLFDNAGAPLLATLNLSDATLAPLIDDMSREGDGANRRMINYRDLSVQHLGSIYEGLLEQDIAPDGKGGILLRPNAFSRKTTGSYYTPEELVKLIIRRTIGPLLAERRATFTARNAQLATDKRTKAEREKLLQALDPAEAFVSLRVCDPAMGSGHFLVSLVDYLTDEVLKAMAGAQTEVTWAEYRSPLATRIEALRESIRAQAAANNWPVREDQLDDKHLARRIILKRVIYGVDMNPMAVELAKLSLWLHSFTVGAPLSFLDHHLRLGDSLFGEFTGPVGRELQSRYGLVKTNAIASAAASAKGMAMVERLTDSDIGEVKQSEAAFAGVEEATADLRALLDLYHAARWLPPVTAAEIVSREALFGESYGDLIDLAKGAAPKPPKADAMGLKWKKEVVTAKAAYHAAANFLSTARALAAERKFLHWEAAFPGVWEDWQSLFPRGGFDAVIGNPPWDRMKMQEVEWFAARVPAVALSQRASDRKKAVAALRKAGNTVVADYDKAVWVADAASRVASEPAPKIKDKNEQKAKVEVEAKPRSRDYPLLSGGDINLYSLFVERAQKLVRAHGIVGLLVPSGIAADLGASTFFRSISTTGRLGSLLDFENRRTQAFREPFFADVDSRFKFCALVFGGMEKTFPEAECAFFQQDTELAESNAFALTPSDFDAVNPNTGTAPVFRNERDAAITRAIYARVPVLVDKRVNPPKAVWPVRYSTMFHMTNDSDKFRTSTELEKLGAYKVKGGHWEKGDQKWLPLYEGKMVQAYDHRAASITVNPENVKRPAQPEDTTEVQHTDPAWLPNPQFFVSESDLPKSSESWTLGLKHISAATNLRTVIMAVCPRAGFGNSMPIFAHETMIESPEYHDWASKLLANMNSFALDFVARQKLHGNNLNWFVLEQLPIVDNSNYARKFGPKTAAKIIAEDVLHLTYVSHDMQPFAADQGYTGPPFAWDEEDRLRRRARLDAVFFHLYGIAWEDAEYILSTFPIVQREEITKFGRFRSRDLIRAYMAALTAGAPDADVEG